MKNQIRHECAVKGVWAMVFNASFNNISVISCCL